MRKLYFIFFTYLQICNNLLSIVYSRRVRNLPSSSTLDKFLNSIFSKTKRPMETFYSIFSTDFFMYYRITHVLSIVPQLPEHPVHQRRNLSCNNLMFL